jgi:copper chaperone CopZ
MIKSHYYVTRLQNAEMRTQLKNSLYEMDGVNMVNIDMGRGSIEVGYDESIDENTIRQCIENIGVKIN